MTALRNLSDRTRAGVLFGHFFLVILAYYLIKPASRSLYLEFYSAAQLPYVWVLSALVLAALMPAYARLVSKASRRKLVLGTSLSISVSLLFFHAAAPGPISAVLLYVFVDIVSVVLVEQFWSLANSMHGTAQGKRWYGLISSGGLLGGIVAGLVVNGLMAHAGLSTMDLLLVGAAMIIVLAGYTDLLGHQGLMEEDDTATALPGLPERPRAADWIRHPYLLAIAGIALMTQLVEPLVEYQFMHYVAQDFPAREARTAFLANFFSVMGVVGLAINLIATPWIHKRLGAVSGLLAQPLILLGSSIVFLGSPGLAVSAAAKMADRSLAYSIGRASRELLYVPVSADLIYKLKAWIDMFGYRVFKMLGALGILALGEWSGIITDVSTFSWLIVLACFIWILLVLRLAPIYEAMTASRSPAPLVKKPRMPLIAELQPVVPEQRLG